MSEDLCLSQRLKNFEVRLQNARLTLVNLAGQYEFQTGQIRVLQAEAEKLKALYEVAAADIQVISAEYNLILTEMSQREIREELRIK